MNPMGNFTADTNGATWEQESDQELMLYEQRFRERLREKWKRQLGINDPPKPVFWQLLFRRSPI